MLHLFLQSVLIVGGTVHSMAPGEEARVADLLVVDGRIEAIGPDLEAPEGAEVIDAAGRHLVPGLMDGMIHHDLEHDPLYLHAGITLARDMGNDLGRIFFTARPSVRDNAPGPALLICGAVFDGVPPATTESIVVTAARDVDDKLSRLLSLSAEEPQEDSAGVDFVSFHQGIPVEAWRRLIELSHENGLAAWGPVPRGAHLAQVLAARQDGLVYIEGLLPIGPQGRSLDWAEADLEALAPSIAALRGGGLALMPLLRAYAQRVEDPGPEPPILARLSPQYESLWRHELDLRRPHLGEDYLRTGREVVVRQQALLLALHEAGVALLPGSGAPNPWLPPGEALHEELALWAEAGIPPLEVLRHATAGAARILGVEDRRGTLRPGLVADLLVLEGDPALDLSTLRRPSHVLLRGRVLERAELDGLLDRLIEAQAEVRARDSRPIEVSAPDLPEGALVLSGYVEASAYGQRFSGERYAVVREPDGTIAYVGRVVTPGGVGSAPTRLQVTQRIAEVESPGGIRRPTLTSFVVEILTAGHRIEVEGRRVGAQFHVRRAIDGVQIDNNATTLRPMFVDAGSATAALILAQHVRPGAFDVVYFEDLEPAVGQWAMEERPGGVLAVATARGPLVSTYKAHGGLDKLERVHGQGRVRMEGSEARTYGGPGLPLPRERVADSAPPAPKSPTPDPPADPPAKRDGAREGDER